MKSKKDCLFILRNIQNGIEQERVVDWLINNNLSEIKTPEELGGSRKISGIN